jgi:hypothetical protein
MVRLLIVMGSLLILSVYGAEPEVAAATERTPVEAAQPDDYKEDDQDDDVIIMEDDDDADMNPSDQDSD